MNTLLLKALAVVLLLAGLCGTSALLAWKYQASKVTLAQERVEHLSETIKELQEARRRADAASTAARNERQRLRVQRDAEKPRADSALSANRAWADTPVPKEVQDVLQ